jgi:hypothetical protein
MSVYKFKYRVVRTSEEPVEVVNGIHTGTYHVEQWTSQDRGKTFLFTRVVKDDLSFEEATEIRNTLMGDPPTINTR